MSSVQVRVTTFEYQSPNFAYYELFADETHLATNAVENYAAFKLVFFADYAIHANLQFGDTWHYWIRAVYDNGATEGPLFYLGSITISGTSDGTDDQTAAEVPYDDTTTGLGAGNVQEAIEALAAGVSEGDGGGGALVLITETVTTGSAANVTFTPPTTTYRDLEISLRGRGDTASADIEITVQFNGDTGNNYSSFRQIVFNGINDLVTVTAGSAMKMGRLAAANAANASERGFLRIEVGDYRGTAGFKQCNSYGTYRRATTDPGIFICLGGGEWSSTAAITSVKLFPLTGNFADGTIVSLYARM